MSEYIGKKITVSGEPIEILSAKFTGAGCGPNMEVIKKMDIKCSDGNTYAVTENELIKVIKCTEQVK